MWLCISCINLDFHCRDRWAHNMSSWGDRLHASDCASIDLDLLEEARSTAPTRKQAPRDRSRSRDYYQHSDELAPVYRQLCVDEMFALNRSPASSSPGTPGPTVQAQQQDLEPATDVASSRRIISVLSRPLDDDNAGIDFELPDNVFDTSPMNTPDALACSWLMSGRVTFKQLRKLFDMLPTVVTKRHQSPHITTTTEARAIHFGAWVHGGNIGITTNCANFPNVVKLLCRLLHTLHPQGLYSTVFLALNVPSGVHSDPHNHSEVENVLVPLSNFTGGDLFVADKHGSFKLDCEGLTGCIKPITLPYTTFWARRKHAVLPWQGNRFLMGSYHVRNSEWLKKSDQQRLEELGMKLL